MDSANAEISKEEILKAYEVVLNRKEEISSSESTIQSLLSNFVVNGTQLGTDVYGTSGSNYNTDIDLPTDLAEYKKLNELINEDIENINYLIELIGHIQIVIYTLEYDSDLDTVLRNLIDMSNELNDMLYERYNLQSMIANMASKINEINTANASNNMNNQLSGGMLSGLGGGGGYSSGGSSSGGGSSGRGGAKSQDKPTSGNSSNTGLVINNYDNSSYVPLLEFSGINDLSSIKNSAANLAEHEESVASVLNNVIFNGNVVGSGVYNTADAGGNADNVDFDSAALYMGIDMVKADIEATAELINQLAEQIDADNQEIEINNQEIENNNQEIAELQEQIAALEASIPAGDDEESAEARAQIEEQIAALEEQIAALEERNAELEDINNQLADEIEELTAEKENYEERKVEKEQVFDELVGIRNAYNEACGNILDLYAANGLLNNLEVDGDNISLYGVSLTGEQASNLFSNIETMLVNHQDSYSLAGNDFSGLDGSQLTSVFDNLLNGSKEAKAAFDGYSNGDISLGDTGNQSNLLEIINTNYGEGLKNLNELVQTNLNNAGLNGESLGINGNKLNADELAKNASLFAGTGLVITEDGQIAQEKVDKDGNVKTNVISDPEAIITALKDAGCNCFAYNDRIYFNNDNVAGALPKDSAGDITVAFAWAGAGSDWSQENRQTLSDRVLNQSENTMTLFTRNLDDSTSALAILDKVVSETNINPAEVICLGNSNGVYSAFDVGYAVSNIYNDANVVIGGLDSYPMNSSEQYNRLCNEVNAMHGNNRVSYFYTTVAGTPASEKCPEVLNSGNDFIYINWHDNNDNGYKIEHAADLQQLPNYISALTNSNRGNDVFANTNFYDAVIYSNGGYAKYNNATEAINAFGKDNLNTTS